MEAGDGVAVDNRSRKDRSGVVYGAQLLKIAVVLFVFITLVPCSSSSPLPSMWSINMRVFVLSAQGLRPVCAGLLVRDTSCTGPTT